MNILDQARKIPHGIEVIADWLGDGGSVVSQEKAQARADVCLQCPENVHPKSVTKPVALAIKKFLAVKNELHLTVNGEKNLGHCNVCTCVLRLQIWQPDSKVARELSVEEIEKLSALAKPCWKLQTITEITP